MLKVMSSVCCSVEPLVIEPLKHGFGGFRALGAKLCGLGPGSGGKHGA